MPLLKRNLATVSIAPEKFISRVKAIIDTKANSPALLNRKKQIEDRYFSGQVPQNKNKIIAMAYADARKELDDLVRGVHHLAITVIDNRVDKIMQQHPENEKNDIKNNFISKLKKTIEHYFLKHESEFNQVFLKNNNAELVAFEYALILKMINEDTKLSKEDKKKLLTQAELYQDKYINKSKIEAIQKNISEEQKIEINILSNEISNIVERAIYATTQEHQAGANQYTAQPTVAANEVNLKILEKVKPQITQLMLQQSQRDELEIPEVPKLKRAKTKYATCYNINNLVKPNYAPQHLQQTAVNTQLCARLQQTKLSPEHPKLVKPKENPSVVAPPTSLEHVAPRRKLSLPKNLDKYALSSSFKQALREKIVQLKQQRIMVAPEYPVLQNYNPLDQLAKSASCSKISLLAQPKKELAHIREKWVFSDNLEQHTLRPTFKQHLQELLNDRLSTEHFPENSKVFTNYYKTLRQEKAKAFVGQATSSTELLSKKRLSN